MGRERPNARGEATRLEILLKAEELFAERGISVVPLRDIGVAAGQKNNVAVQYHFGDRETLVREITKYRAATSEQARADMLVQLLSRGEPATVTDLVSIFIRSLACHLTPDNHYLAFLSRYVVTRGGYEGLDRLENGGSHFTMQAMLRHLLPDFPPDVLDERWMVMMTSVVHTLARYQAADRAGTLAGPIATRIDELVTFFAAGISARTTDAAAPKT